MNRPTRQGWMFAALLLMPLGCGVEAPDDGSVTGDEYASTTQALRPPAPRLAGGFWLDSLPAELTNARVLETVETRHYAFTVGEAWTDALEPRHSVLWVHKRALDPAFDREASGYAVLGSTYATPAPRLIADPGHDLVVASFEERLTPAGAAFVQLRLVHLSYLTGKVLHSSALSALPPRGTGWVYAEALGFSPAGTLTVQGTKNGVMAGETGTGNSFVATYENLLFNESQSPAPTSVAAY